jgi:FMN phosphatase YigB (HAD superfamily)
MRGEFTYQQINQIIASSTGIQFDTLTDLFRQSVHEMKLDQKILNFALELKSRKIPIAIVTDNMDIFNEITIPAKNLLTIFPIIINSFDYKIRKRDNNGQLFDIALEKLGIVSYKDVVLIDDSEKTCKLFEQKGGRAYLFVNDPQINNFLYLHSLLN